MLGGTLVSILMPMKNAEAYIQETLQSLLNQSFLNFEILVVNDGSNDNSQALAEGFADSRIKILQGGCEGISAALNMALEQAQGEYVCRCDADDLYPPERLMQQVNWLESHSDYIAVAGKFSSLDEKSRVIAEFNTGNKIEDITQELLQGDTRTHLGTFLIKLSVIKELKGFREYFVTAEDIDMQLRLAEQGNISYLPGNMYFYRIHNSSITHVQSSNKREFYEQTARDFLRQRRREGFDQLENGTPPDAPVMDNKPSDSKAQVVGYLLGESWRLHVNKNKSKAVDVAFRACMTMPLNWRVWKNIIMILVKS